MPETDDSANTDDESIKNTSGLAARAAEFVTALELRDQDDLDDDRDQLPEPTGSTDAEVRRAVEDLPWGVTDD